MSTSLILGVAVVVFSLMLVGLILTAREASKWDDLPRLKAKTSRNNEPIISVVNRGLCEDSG